MDTTETFDHRAMLRDPRVLAHLERNLRSAGMSRRAFLTLASTVAGTAALAACGGSSGPTATSMPTLPPTRVVPSATVGRTAGAAPTNAAASAVAPTSAAGSATIGTRAAGSAASGTATGGAVPAGGTTLGPTAAAATGPESTKLAIDYLTAEPVDNDFNRDLYAGGVSQHMVGLLRYDQDFNLIPELAESFTVSGTTYTFKLRKDATWSDGKPVTAQDFVYSWRRMTDPRTANGYGSFWNGVIKGATELNSAKPDDPNLSTLIDALGVKAADDKTFVIDGDKFHGLIPGQSAYVAAVVAREDVVTKYADAKGVSSWTDPGKTGAPVLTCAPFQIAAWKHNQQLDLVKNDKYWNAKAIRQKYVTWKIIPDITKSTLPFENNDVDYQIIPASEVDRFKSDAKLKPMTFKYVYPGTRFIVPDTGHPPFDKLEVRKATILAIDKDRLVNQVGRGIHLPAYAMTAPGVFGYFDDDDNKLKNIQKYDPKAAMEVLKGTTFEGGRNWPKVTLSWNSSDTDIPTGYPDEIARQLKQNLSMDVQLEPLENKVWNARRFALDLQFLLYRWYQDYPDPHNEYYQVWALHNKGQARQSWTDKEFDDLCSKAAAEADRQKRLDLYYMGETRIQMQFAYQPIHWRVDNYAIHPWITDVPKNKQGYVVMNTNIFSRLWDRAYVSEDSPNAPPR